MNLKQSEPAIADIPAIVFSAIAPIYIEGAEGVLDKPVDSEHLIKLVSHYFDTNKDQSSVLGISARV